MFRGTLRFRHTIMLVVALAVTLSLAVPALASAAGCQGVVEVEKAGVYANSNGTGFIKWKYRLEEVKGPYIGADWYPGANSPWVEVYVSGGGIGFMNVNYIDGSLSNCHSPW